MPETTFPDPADYLSAEQLAEARKLYRQFVVRLRSNLRARLRRIGIGPGNARVDELRAQITASVRVATATDADARELHQEWMRIAKLTRWQTTAPEELTGRLEELAGLMNVNRQRALAVSGERTLPPVPDELLHLDSAGDALYAAPPRGKHGTLLSIQPGEGEVYVPTNAVDVFRAALKGNAPLDEAAIRADERVKALAERALAVAWSEWDESVPPRDRILRDMAELTRIADPDHIARRGARTHGDLNAYRTVVLREAAAAIDRAAEDAEAEAVERDGHAYGRPNKAVAIHREDAALLRSMAEGTA